MSRKRISKVIRKGNVVTGPDHNYPMLEGGMGVYIYKACEKYGDKVCQICWSTGKTESFASFNERCVRLAVQMRKIGIKKSDVIITCSKNTLDSALPSISALYLGAVCGNLDPSLSARDTAHLLGLVRPKMIFVHEDAVELIENALSIAEITSTEIAVMGNSDKYQIFSNFCVRSECEESFRPLRVAEDDASLMLFSSGTTGLPKGILLKHQSIYIGGLTYFDLANKPSTMAHFSTLYWISGVMSLISQFVEGSARLGINDFDPKSFFSAVEKYKIELTFMASSYGYKLMEMKDIHKYDTSSLRMIIFGGSPLAGTQLLKVRAMLPKTHCFNGYGLTEIASFATGFPVQDNEFAEACPKSCGRPITGMILKVVNPETEKSLGANKTGELRVKCASMMLGYYNVDSSESFDSEGFFKTGDVGHYDENCCFYVYDRLKEMFKYQCWHMVPASIESIIKEHPEITEAVVFGIPTDQGDNLVTAAVTVRAVQITPEEIESFVAERVPDRQKLRGGVFILPEIPKTPSQKVLRRKVQEVVLQMIAQEQNGTQI